MALTKGDVLKMFRAGFIGPTTVAQAATLVEVMRLSEQVVQELKEEALPKFIDIEVRGYLGSLPVQSRSGELMFGPPPADTVERRWLRDSGYERRFEPWKAQGAEVLSAVENVLVRYNLLAQGMIWLIFQGLLPRLASEEGDDGASEDLTEPGTFFCLILENYQRYPAHLDLEWRRARESEEEFRSRATRALDSYIQGRNYIAERTAGQRRADHGPELLLRNRRAFEVFVRYQAFRESPASIIQRLHLKGEGAADVTKVCSDISRLTRIPKRPGQRGPAARIAGA